MDPASLHQKLLEREREGRLRSLQAPPAGIDFFSNDYLGLVRNGILEKSDRDPSLPHGSTGSRLLSGNHPLASETEDLVARFHNSAAGLLFGSGYEANLGLLSAVAGRGDTILYDQLAHASIRDGIRLSMAKSHSFLHNDPADLKRLLEKTDTNCFVVTESVFSMDGDQAPLRDIASLCAEFNAFLIVDEAHATGVAGPGGAGLVQALGLENQCFARVHTFGKALGCHGAIVLGSATLKDYLVNFCRPFIYTTALPPAGLEAIANSYRIFPGMDSERNQLNALIFRFRSTLARAPEFSDGKKPAAMLSESPIQAILIPGNEKVYRVSARLRSDGFAVYPIYSPTVKEGTERLRIILHAFNSQEETDRLAAAVCQAIGG